MTASLVAGFIRVPFGANTAMLPIRHQGWTGLPLLIAAPVLLWLIGRDYGAWVALVAVFAFVSMFRHPLKYNWKRLSGQDVELPPELQKKKKT